MDANQRKQGRINNTAAAISAGTLGDPSQDPNLPWQPTRPYVDAHNTDADGQRDAQNEAWLARARREADDIYDYSQPSNRPPHRWTDDEEAALLAVLRGGDCFSSHGIDFKRVAAQLNFDVDWQQCSNRWQSHLKDTTDGSDALAAGRAASGTTAPTAPFQWTAAKDAAVLALVGSGVGVQPLRAGGARVSHKAVAERLDFVVTERQLTVRWCALKKKKEGRAALVAGLEAAKAAPAAPGRRRVATPGVPTASSAVPLRKGNWDAPERRYATMIAGMFVEGRLENCADGTMLYALLAERLFRKEGSVKSGKKKFTNVTGISSRAFVRTGALTDEERAELGRLETAFRESFDAGQRWALAVADAEPTPGAAAAATDGARAVWPRVGAWNQEEDARLVTLVAAFEAGRASCSPGETLETFLSRELGCSRYRIALKFKGNGEHGTELDGRTFAPNEGDARDADAAVAMEEDAPTRPGTPAPPTAPSPVPHGNATDATTPPGDDTPMAEAPAAAAAPAPAAAAPAPAAARRGRDAAPLAIGRLLPPPPPKPRRGPRQPKVSNMHREFVEAFNYANEGLELLDVDPLSWPASPGAFVGFNNERALESVLLGVQQVVATVRGGVVRPNDPEVLRVMYARLRRDHEGLLRAAFNEMFGRELSDVDYEGIAEVHELIAVKQETAYSIGALALVHGGITPLFEAYPETWRSYFSGRACTKAVADHVGGLIPNVSGREFGSLMNHRRGDGDGDVIQRDEDAPAAPFAAANDADDASAAHDDDALVDDDPASRRERVAELRAIATREFQLCDGINAQIRHLQIEIQRLAGEHDARKARAQRAVDDAARLESR
ncbi:unnamed protein product [Pelagomonas calceolata]|uniref:Myb-like domain-containing protein n=2 Tax=Pelagomonas calceolata TaxID=35677 RepID=A0A8J2S339_9STRA|nr:unnamed protein product [Pelagomonas calceolata]